MAHWSDKHTKKDIVNFYEVELANLRAENEMLREALGNFADSYDAKKRLDWTGAVCFSQSALRKAKEALK